MPETEEVEYIELAPEAAPDSEEVIIVEQELDNSTDQVNSEN